MPISAAILAPEGLSLSAQEAAFFKDAQPLGFIVFARNVESPRQLRRLTGQLRDAVGRDAMIFVDQEGGRVQRLRAPHWREWLPPLDQAVRAGGAAPRSFWIRSRLMAAELRDVGIDANCAPTCDIAGPETHPFLRNRCLGTEPGAVAENARATAEGLMAGGVLPVMKHMPGHGRGKVDSHAQLPVADVGIEDASDWDFAPFRALADLPMGMSAHIVFPEVSPLPATQSPEMIRLIREDMGFAGLLMTDDLSMEALRGTVAERAAISIAAGCDIALHCNGDMGEMAAVVRAAGDLDGVGMVRAVAALSRRLPPEDVDIAALDAELDALLRGSL
jgi:beta-N-acetylhexosaminidase